MDWTQFENKASDEPVNTSQSVKDTNDKWAQYTNENPYAPTPKKEINAFVRGLSESASGKITQLINGEKGLEPKTHDPDQGFLSRVLDNAQEMAGTVVGDLPYMAAGGTVGAAAGTLVEPGIGTIAGAGFGSLATPAFIKAAIQEYQDFQKSGKENLTFGEWLQKADNVASKTLREGAFGVTLGTLKHLGTAAKGTPFEKLFTAKYTPVLETGAEIGTAATLPAISEGRLPNEEELVAAPLMIGGMKLASKIPTTKISKAKPVEALKKWWAGKADPEKLKIAERFKAATGKDLPLSETGHLGADSLETIVKMSAGGQKQYNDMIQGIDQSVIDVFKKGLEESSTKEYESSLEAGESAKKAIKEIKSTTTPEELYPGKAKPSAIFQNTPREGAKKPSRELKVTAPAKKQTFFERNAPQPTKRTSLIGRQIQQGESPFQMQTPGQYRNSTNRYVDSIANETFRSDVHGGEQLVRTLQAEERQIRQYFRESYTELGEMARNAPGFIDPQLGTELRELRSNLGDTYIPNADSAEAKVIKIIDDLIDQVQLGTPGSTNYRELHLKNLIGTAKTLSSVANYEVHAGVKEYLKAARRLVNESIQRNGQRIAPEVAEGLRTLDAEYADLMGERFGNDTVSKYLSRGSRDFETLYKQSGNTDDIRSISRALEVTPNGNALLNRMQRDLFEKKFGKDLRNIHEPKKLEQYLTPEKTRELQNFRETLGPEQQVVFDNYLQSLQDASRSRHLGPIPERQLTGRVKNPKKPEAKPRPIYTGKFEKLPSSTEQTRMDVANAILGVENPEKIIKGMDSLAETRKVKSVLEKTDQGNDVFKSIGRFKAEQKFQELFLSQKEGRFDYSKFQKELFDKDNVALLKEWVSPEYVKQLKELHSISFELSDQFKKKATESTFAQKTVRDALKLLTFGKQIFTEPGTAAGVSAGILAQQKLAKIMTDSQFISEMNTLAKLAKGNDIQALNKSVNNINHLISQSNQQTTPIQAKP